MNDARRLLPAALFLMSVTSLLAACGLGRVISESKIEKIRKEILQAFPIGSNSAGLELLYVERVKASGISGSIVEFYQPTDSLIDYVGFSTKTPDGCSRRKSEITYRGSCRNFLALNYCTMPDGTVGFLEVRDGGYC